MKNPLRFLAILSAFLGGSLSLSVHAAVLASYSFPGGSVASSDTDPDSTASVFSAGSGISAGAGYSNDWAEVSSSYMDVDPPPTSDPSGAKADSVAADNYFGFTITPEEGYSVTLTNFSLRASYYSDSETSGRRGYFFLRSSADNFASDLQTGTWLLEINQQNGAVFFDSPVVDLTSELPGAVTSSLELRIYLSSNSQRSSNNFAIDDVIVEGSTAAIPEPTSFVLMVGTLSMVLVGIRRRRSSRTDQN